MKHKQITFKPYSMEQLSLLPPILEELIPEKHLVRVVNQVVDELNIEPLLAKYKGGELKIRHILCQFCVFPPFKSEISACDTTIHYGAFIAGITNTPTPQRRT